MLRQITKAEAIAIGERKGWEPWTYKMRAVFQLRQRRLCMPFDVFHEAVEKTLQRPVFTHEFGLNWEGLLAEAEGKVSKPTLEAIIKLIPPEKVVVVNAPRP